MTFANDAYRGMKGKHRGGSGIIAKMQTRRNKTEETRVSVITKKENKITSLGIFVRHQVCRKIFLYHFDMSCPSVSSCPYRNAERERESACNNYATS